MSRAKSIAAKWRRDHQGLFVEPTWRHRQLFDEGYRHKPQIIPHPPRTFRKLPPTIRQIAHMLEEGLTLSEITAETGLSTVEIEQQIESYKSCEMNK